MRRDSSNNLELGPPRLPDSPHMRPALKRKEFLTRRRLFLAYLFAVSMPFVAAGSRVWLSVHTDVGGPLIMFFFIFPSLLASTLGGLWPGLLATGISVALLSYFILPPIQSFGISMAADWVRLGTVTALSLIITILNSTPMFS